MIMKEIKTFLAGLVVVSIGMSAFVAGAYAHSWLSSIEIGRAIIDIFVGIFGLILIIILVYASGRLVMEFFKDELG